MMNEEKTDICLNWAGAYSADCCVMHVWNRFYSSESTWSYQDLSLKRELQRAEIITMLLGS